MAVPLVLVFTLGPAEFPKLNVGFSLDPNPEFEGAPNVDVFPVFAAKLEPLELFVFAP